MFTDLLIDTPVYSLNKKEKSAIFDDVFSQLTRHHYDNCYSYKKMMDGLGYDPSARNSYTVIPFLPVRLFKMHDLLSIPRKEVVKTLTSSGTSGQAVSKIYLDKETSLNQSKVLTKIVSTFIGSQRTPMIIIDSPSVLKNRNMFSARGAGVLGFSIFGSKRIYALDEGMTLDVDSIVEFIQQNEGKRLFLFGFTFMVYQHFIKEMKGLGIKLDLSNAVLIHGGGWKKLINEAVSPSKFRELLFDYCELKNVHDYYGMVEQTGSIYMECEYGHLHASVFSDILIRRPIDFSIADIGEKGIIQVLSILPKSYPGHSLLTEDEGILLGEDDCKCGRLGKYFEIVGRLKNAEIRGCSDTYAEQF